MRAGRWAGRRFYPIDVTRHARTALAVLVAVTPVASTASDALRAADRSASLLAFDQGCELWLLGDDWRPRLFKKPAWGSDWSPDGKRLAFWTGRGVVVNNLSTGRDRVLFKPRRPMQVDCGRYADWAPRGDLIAVVLNDGVCGSPTLAVVSAGGRPLVRIARAPLCDGYIPFAWSPRGTELAYARCDLVGPGGESGRDCRLFRVGADGHRNRRLLKNFELLGGLDWSPDGTAITLYAGLRSGPGEGDAIRGSEGLYVLELRTRKLRRIVREPGGRDGGYLRGFAWSPDGAWLAYTRDVRGFRPNGMFLVSRDGRRARTLLKPGRVQYGSLTWSADRRLIAADASAPVENTPWTELHVIDPRRGVVLHRLRFTGVFVSSLAWRPR